MQLQQINTSHSIWSKSELDLLTGMLNNKLSEILLNASTHPSDDEEYSELENQLMTLVTNAWGFDLTTSIFDTLAHYVFDEMSSRPMKQILSASHALTALGKMRHIETKLERRIFLERVVKEASNAYIRSGAILGLAYVNDAASLDAIREVESREVDRTVKKQLQRVREQLEQTLAEQQ